MANKPLLRKQFWTVINKYAQDLKGEFKRNGTVEGKALGTKDEAPIALKVIDNQLAAIGKKANAAVKESKGKGAKKSKKAASKKAKAKSGAFATIPSISGD